MRWFGRAAYYAAVLFVIGYLTLLFARNQLVEAQWETDLYVCHGDANCMREKGWSKEWDMINPTFNEG